VGVSDEVCVDVEASAPKASNETVKTIDNRSSISFSLFLVFERRATPSLSGFDNAGVFVKRELKF
jgi:hypothetical protein